MSLNAFGQLLFAIPLYLDLGLIVALVLAVRHRASRRWRLAGYVLAPALVASLLVGAPAFSNAWMWRLEHRYDPPAIRESDRHPDNLIVVLSAGWARPLDGGRVELKRGEDGWERTYAGVVLWRQIGGTLLFTGGPSPNVAGESEAGAMAGLARELGVPAGALAVEPAARNTYENLTRSLPWIRAHEGHVWLVTSALHLPRAMAIALHLGVRPVPVPCHFVAERHAPLSRWLPDNNGPVHFDNVLHEELGMIVYRHRGWVD